LCREHNLSDSLSHNWKKLYREKGEAAFTAPTHSRTSTIPTSAEDHALQALRNKVAELERLLGQQTVELTILPTGYPFGAKKASEMVSASRLSNGVK